ncbi:YqhA family protein [Gelidibacter sp.]|uniref:YqhA family protein n=1 Tax=Gelidibacter sp. TaxID=2018083 RepID=UPI002BC38A56|nr:YqhA family protein [Gelidibacter sp.]HUH28935.1 YqhA family protein [Gelidibacter sp.]
MKLVLRFAIAVICIFTFLNALVFVGISVYHSIHGYTIILSGNMAERPGVHLAEALDTFLLATVFIIFAIGIGKLFVPDNKLLKKIQLSWLNPKSFSDLKGLLWEAVLTTLVVLFATSLVHEINNLRLELLILPAAILLIAIALRMMKSSH